MYYRIEVNPNNIGTILETPFSLNPTRVGITQNSLEWRLLSTLVDLSLMNDISLLNICNAAIQQNPVIADFLPGIWEVMMEMARPNNVPLMRTQCTFFFKDMNDVLCFQQTYPGMMNGKICEVEIIQEVFKMECDMNWLDSIDEKTAKASETIDALKKYWSGQLTSQPVIEILFAGKYKLKQI